MVTGMAKDQQSALQQPLGPPDDLYRPTGVKTQGVLE